MTRKRRPPVIEALGKLRGVGQLNDANLQDLHDLCLIALAQCQHELKRRGSLSDVVLVRRAQETGAHHA